MTPNSTESTSNQPLRPAEPRLLVVNADDFGLSPGVNRGIIQAHEQGILTSASLMVRPAAAIEAAEYAKATPALSVGLHIDLAEWVYRDDAWTTVYQIVPPDDAAAVEREVRRQLAEFIRLTGRPPTHIDSHQHLHRQQPARGIVTSLAAELRIPVREITAGIQYNGDFYGQDGEGRPVPEGITRESLMRIIATLSGPITELGCHPGSDPELASCYRNERQQEVDALCDPAVRAAIQENPVRLVSFADWSLRGFIGF